jgi:prepilin-type N-terminal cleavage/methylation domain-containing protein
MCVRRSSQRRRAFTLIEMLVVIAIILVLSALAAAFMPRVADSTNLSNAVDQLEQWLLTAKMRAKRDGLTTGLRLIQDPNVPAGLYTQCQYIQQPDPLVGGVCVGAPAPPPAYPVGGNYYTGGLCTSVTSGSPQLVHFYAAPPFGVDFTGGQGIVADYLVQPGDYLELRDGGGVHPIVSVPNGGTLAVSAAQPIALTAPTTNYRILRQPRPVLGENPLQMPGNMAVDLNVNPNIPQPPPPNPPILYSQVNAGVSGAYDILFSPSGAVVGSNAGLGKIFLYVHDYTIPPSDVNRYTRAGIVAVQTLTGYIGAYNAGPDANPYIYANEGRTSGL